MAHGSLDASLEQPPILHTESNGLKTWWLLPPLMAGAAAAHGSLDASGDGCVDQRLVLLLLLNELSPCILELQVRQKSLC